MFRLVKFCFCRERGVLGDPWVSDRLSRFSTLLVDAYCTRCLLKLKPALLPQNQALDMREKLEEEALGPVTNISSESDVEQRLLLREECTTNHLREVKRTWKDELVDLPLMDKMVSPRGLTHNFDLKHIEAQADS